jgi:ferrous iron transport protein A
LGDRAEVSGVNGRGGISQRLLAMGFLPGTPLRVVQVAPFGDPITIELDGWRVSLRRAEAALVDVRTAPGGGA